MRILIILIMLMSSTLMLSQQLYEIPFSSKGNSIELTVSNTSKINLKNVKVSAEEVPAWIEFDEQEETISQLEGNKERAVTFKFTVKKEAPVKEETKLKFRITNGRGESWEKEIAVEVSPPKEFKLYQNYPNPFNPSTTISYTIPTLETLHATSPQLTTVRLTIFDILGREVATLVNKEQQPGFYKVNWSAGNYASGMYIYQIIAKYKSGERKIQRKKMLLMK